VGILIDSSVLIEAERQRRPVGTVFGELDGDEPLAIAAITASELLLGIHLSAPSRQRDARAAFIEDVLASVIVLDFDLAVAQRYAEVWAALRRSGNIIAPHDLMIGSTALTYDFAVLTHNVRDFDRIQGLQVRLPSW
jgi:predicted nucleic acid-binding protein